MYSPDPRLLQRQPRNQCVGALPTGRHLWNWMQAGRYPGGDRLQLLSRFNRRKKENNRLHPRRTAPYACRRRAQNFGYMEKRGGTESMKLETSLKHFSPQGMDISDVVNKTGAENDA